MYVFRAILGFPNVCQLFEHVIGELVRFLSKPPDCCFPLVVSIATDVLNCIICAELHVRM